jgi:23S rRNA pseudouridine1911/1915/1917 synthase
VARAADGQRLDVVVRAALDGATPRPLSNSDVRRVLAGGGVRIDGRVVRGAGRPLHAGQRLSVVVDLSRLASQGVHAGVPPVPHLLFEDADLVAVDKPAGVPTVPTADPRRRSLVDQVRLCLAARGRGAQPALGVHQRLDAATTGVVVFSKTPAAAAGLDALFASRRVEKTYLALCAVAEPAAGLAASGRISSALDVSGRGKGARVTSSPDGRAAVTAVRVLERLGPAALVEARPATGRKHQVRAHLADAGLPLLGDARYGGPTRVRGRAIPRPMLHASRLALPHPVGGPRLSIDAPLPDDFASLLAWMRGDAPAPARAESSPVPAPRRGRPAGRRW